jgi:hypothetical protein
MNVNAPVIAISAINGLPSSLPTGGKASVSATVSNDPASGGGVDWAVACTPGVNGDCGTFSSGLPTDHTASGVATTYTAPKVIPAGSPAGNVTITATSHANPASFSTATIPITASTAISIKFAAADTPPVTLTTLATANLAAVVTNDNVNPPNGVDWTVTCGSTGAGACGSFSLNPAHTASNVVIIYTAPPSVPTGNTVTIIATSTADPTQSVSATVTIINPVVVVTITQANSPLTAGSAETIIASVQNDSAKEGVSWTAACTNPTGAGCGIFNPQQSPGNSPQTSYTAPSAVPSSGLSVTITATSTANGITTGTATITVTPNPNLGLLSGPYALSLSGINGSGFYAIVGSLNADGLGDITGGEEDINGLAVCTPSTAPTVTGSYSIGPDGRGTMTLNTSNNCFGQTVSGVVGVQTMSFVVVGSPTSSTPRALITEFDNSTASGSLDLQSGLSGGLAAISGGYAFTLDGLDINGPNGNGVSNADVGGAFTANSGTISSGVQDVNDQVTGTVVKQQAITGTYTAPDPTTGRGTALLGAAGQQFTFVYYMVNPGHLKLLAFDLNNPLVVAGPAFTQGTSFSGPFVFTLAGVDGTLGGPLVAGGLFTASTTSLSAGILDVNDSGPVATNSAFTGTVTAASGGRGTFTVAGTNTGGLSEFAFYPTASNGVLLLEIDSTSTFTTVGMALPQTASGSITAATLGGNYALNFTGPIEGGEEDVDGQIISDGVSNLSGTVDVNGGPTTGLGGIAVAGTYAQNANGRFTGPLQLMLSSTSTQTLQNSYYIVDADTVLFIETDANGQVSGIMQLQNLTSP